MHRADKLRFAAGAAVIAAYFLRLAGPSLGGYFSPDDLMNLYRSWSLPLDSLLKANVVFFQNSLFFRPLPSVWYLTIYDFFGFHPLPFHISYLAILLINLWLTYCVARRLSGSREIGGAAALLSAYYRPFAPLYFDTGYIYDVLCFTFYFSALSLYIRARQQGRLPRTWEIAALLAIYIFALNSKEMAVTLPVIVLVYEVLYDSPASWRPGTVATWISRQGRTALLLGLVTGIFLAGRLMGPGSLVAIEVYRPVFTWSQFMATSGRFFKDVITEGREWSVPAMLLLWVGLLAIAWLAKSKVLAFAWLFLMLAPLPIAFIFPRGPSQYYLAWFGWTLFLATVLVRTIEYLARKAWPGREGFPQARSVALFGVLAVILTRDAQGPVNIPTITRDAPINRQAVEQLHSLRPALHPGSKLFFLDDPIPSDWNNLAMIVRLSYGDNSLGVKRAKETGRPSDAELAAFDHVFDFVGGRYFELIRPWTRPTAPMIVFDGEGAIAFRQDGARITLEQPAQAGEEIVTQATNLGSAPVASPVQVRVNGQDAEVSAPVGWPGNADNYGLRFRIPQSTASGMATVEIRVNGGTGPAAKIAVR